MESGAVRAERTRGARLIQYFALGLAGFAAWIFAVEDCGRLYTGDTPRRTVAGTGMCSQASKRKGPMTMAAYAYRMVQVPPKIVVRRDTGQGEAATYMQTVVDQNATQGWEFYRVDQIGVQQSPGCLGLLLGQRQVTTVYYIVSFRRQLS